MDFDTLSLADLFTTADAIGDRYLTDEEIDERAAILQAIEEEIDLLECQQ